MKAKLHQKLHKGCLSDFSFLHHHHHHQHPKRKLFQFVSNILQLLAVAILYPKKKKTQICLQFNKREIIKKIRSKKISHAAFKMEK
jgi:hypothetical protein